MDNNSSSIDTPNKGSFPRRLVHPAALSALFFLLAIVYCASSFAQILATANLDIERRGHTATVLETGKILIVDGENQNGIVGQAEIFDPVSRTPSAVATSLAPRTDHTATRLADGRVLIIGGRDPSGSLHSTEIYNPSVASFSPGPSLIYPRGGHTATILPDEKILVVGGESFG
jgi:hypothetical protein